MTKPSKLHGKKPKQKHYRLPGKRKEGNASKYTTRNKALTRLQLKLPEFRRLCILKGIHPREPKKKFEGHNKTYYHVKDINFLAHEPLLAKSREIKAHERKIRKARAKKNEELALRFEKSRPTYSLDHLVKERYPSFVDALRDMDDSLTMLHLFATLPADQTHSIPAERVHSARRLSLEWQAYVTRTHSLKKTFISVKGIYYQAEVGGQKITWLTPHVLSQVLPNDVDFRVMLTFVEFYETLVGFVNFKLYHSLGLQYPPLLDHRLEAAAAELYAVMKDLSKGIHPIPEDLSGTTDMEDTQSTNNLNEDRVSEEVIAREQRLVESQARLSSLQDRLTVMDKAMSSHQAEKEKDGTAMNVDGMEAEGEEEDEDTKVRKKLFREFKFFLAREVPRESLLFVIRSFGGTVSWEGDVAPFDESDEGITHQIIDRPTQGHRFLSRDYVQPQWVYDCANLCMLIPTEAYLLGRIPPPHLSPFVDNEAEGYIPEYGETMKRLQVASSKVLPLPGTEEDKDTDGTIHDAAQNRKNEVAEATARDLETVAMERAFTEDLSMEVAGVPYSASLQEKVSKDASISEVQVKESLVPQSTSVETDSTSMAHMMMPRKTRKLYEAMQMGREKKKANVELLKERKRKVKDRKTENNSIKI